MKRRLKVVVITLAASTAYFIGLIYFFGMEPPDSELRSISAVLYAFTPLIAASGLGAWVLFLGLWIGRGQDAVWRQIFRLLAATACLAFASYASYFAFGVLILPSLLR